LRSFLGFGKKNKDVRSTHCAICTKELTRHKYKPSPDWNIEGLLCSDCHIEKTRDFILKAEIEKRKESEQKEREERTCHLCKTLIDLDGEKKKPEWKWNMNDGIILCAQCYSKTEAEFNRKLNFCAICNKKIGFFRYNPKQKWKIDGQLCRKCWDEQNMKGKMGG
jgi:hypothetical protein